MVFLSLEAGRTLFYTDWNLFSRFRAEDAAKALDASQGKRFFGAAIVVSQHEGLG